MNSTWPSLHDIASSLRNSIIIMTGGYYSRLHAARVVLLYPKRSNERAKVKKQMIENGYVPGKKSLENLIRDCERGMQVIDEDWSTRLSCGRKRKVCTLESFDSTKFEFLGCIRLAVVPLHTTNNGDTKISIDLYAPPKRHDICHYIGVSRTERLYFSPKQFPTPTNLDNAASDVAFLNLKKYIADTSKDCGFPVICRGGDKSCRYFVCLYHDSTKHCRFSFMVKWDDLGYFIHLYSERTGYFVGCEYHNHCPVRS